MLSACPKLRPDKVDLIQATYMDGLKEARKRCDFGLPRCLFLQKQSRFGSKLIVAVIEILSIKAFYREISLYAELVSTSKQDFYTLICLLFFSHLSLPSQKYRHCNKRETDIDTSCIDVHKILLCLPCALHWYIDSPKPLSCWSLYEIDDSARSSLWECTA